MSLLWWVLGFVLALPAVGAAQRHDIPQEDLGLRIATHYGDGSCSAGTLNAALAAIGSTVATLVIPPVPRNSITPCTWNLATNVTVPATLSLHIPRGVVLTPASDTTLTLHSAPQVGIWRWLNANGTTTGTVLMNAPERWAEWWGADSTGVTDSSAAIEQALEAGINERGVARLSTGQFRVASTIQTPTGASLDFALQGMGTYATVLLRDAALNGAVLRMGVDEVATNEVRLQDFGIECVTDAAGTVGIEMLRSGNNQLLNLRIANCERGMYLNGGSYHSMRKIEFQSNVRALVMDNANNRHVTLARIENSRFRNSKAVSVDIDNTLGTGQPRGMTFVRTAWEHDQVTTGTDIGVRIRQAQQVHFHECWFEDVSRFFDIDGGDSTRKTQYITINNSNFGNHHPAGAALSPVAFVFNGSGVNDGHGSYIRSSRISAGEFQFNQTIFLGVYDVVLEGGSLSPAVLTGNKWFSRRSIDSDSTQYEELVTKRNWTMENVQKDEGHKSRLLRQFSTQTTLGTLGAVLFGQTIVNDGVSYLRANISAMQDTNVQQVSYMVVGFFKNVAGVVTQIGTTQLLHTDIESAGATGWTVEFQIVGNVVNLQVQTGAAITVWWAAAWEILSIRP